MEKDVIITVDGEEEKSPERDPEDEVNEMETEEERREKEKVYIIYAEYMPNAPQWERFRLFSTNYEIIGSVVGKEPCNHMWGAVERYKRRLEIELQGKTNLTIDVREYKLSAGGSGGWDIYYHYTDYGFFGHPYCVCETAYRISFIETEQIPSDR